MTPRQIIPRPMTAKGRQFWRVTVPLDLQNTFKRKTRDFNAEVNAAEFAGILQRSRQPISDLTAVTELLAKLGGNEVIQRAVALHRSQKASETMSEVMVQFMESKTRGGVRLNSLSSLKCSLDSFRKFIEKPVASVTTNDLDAWLNNHEEWTPRTKRGRLIDLKNFFNWCLKREIVTRNPAIAVEIPRIAYQPPPILTVDEIEKILRTAEAHDPKLISYFALILFGGLRPKEAERTEAHCIHDGLVDISGDQTKNNVLRCFEIQPTLAAWIAAPNVVFGWPNIYERIRKIKTLAGVEIKHDALRHSCASYWYQLIGATATASMLGHSESILKRHYANKVTKADAERFVALRPSPITL